LVKMGQLLKSKTFGPQKCALKIGFNAAFAYLAL
jgi:hypothetical protein